MILRRLKRAACAFVVLAACDLRAAEVDEDVVSPFYVGASAALVLPQGGSSMRHLGGAAVRGGWYCTENVALEGDVAWLEDAAGLGVDALWHWQGCSFYGDLFGYSRFDPFFTGGVRGWIGHDQGQVGPSCGIGAFYHLTDNWSLRGEAQATLGLDTRVEMVYGLNVGVQYAF